MNDALPTPAELAELDQALHGRNRQLDAIVDTYREVAPGFLLAEVTIATYAAVLLDRFDRAELADLLACAVARIAGDGGVTP